MIRTIWKVFALLTLLLLMLVSSKALFADDLDGDNNDSQINSSQNMQNGAQNSGNLLGEMQKKN